MHKTTQEKEAIVITIVLTAQFEEAGKEFECALHELLVSRGIVLQYKNTDGDVITMVAKKSATGLNTANELADAGDSCEMTEPVPMVACPAVVAVPDPHDHSACDQTCELTGEPAPQMLGAKILSISSVNDIPCMINKDLENSCLYVKKVFTEPENITFSYGDFIYRYPKARPSSAQQPGICNPNHAVGPNTICCAVILPGFNEAVDLLLTLVPCPSEQDEECLHLGTDISVIPAGGA